MFTVLNFCPVDSDHSCSVGPRLFSWPNLFTRFKFLSIQLKHQSTLYISRSALFLCTNHAKSLISQAAKQEPFLLNRPSSSGGKGFALPSIDLGGLLASKGNLISGLKGGLKGGQNSAARPSYGAPSSSYGAPQGPPSNSYGAPQAAPSSSYGAPQGNSYAAPGNSYAAPQSAAQGNSYAAPAQSNSYGAAPAAAASRPAYNGGGDSAAAPSRPNYGGGDSAVAAPSRPNYGGGDSSSSSQQFGPSSVFKVLPAPNLATGAPPVRFFKSTCRLRGVGEGVGGVLLLMC
jgi:hypothetical protein